MKEKLEKFDLFLNQLNLKRVEKGFSGRKWLIVGIEGSDFVVKLQFTYHGDVFIEEFKGSLEFKKLEELVTKIVEQIKLLEL